MENAMGLERGKAGQAARVGIVGVKSGVGGRDPGAKRGPVALRAAGLDQRLVEAGVLAHWLRMLQPARVHGASPMEIVSGLVPRLAVAVRDALSAGTVPLVIGGDHSCAIGTWSGVRAATRARGALGLVWIDAHLDSHTPQTSHTGLIYGMPLAALLGHGDPAFTNCLEPGPKLEPQHVCILGARSYEAEERALLQQIGVRVIEMPEVERMGVQRAMDEALAIARRAPGGYGISLDLDAIDPRDAPGVGTPAAYGLRAAELISALGAAHADPRLVALEIVEYNPGRDRDGVTMRHAIDIAATVLGQIRTAARRAA